MLKEVSRGISRKISQAKNDLCNGNKFFQKSQSYLK